MTPIANVNDRASIERIYPLDRFRQDANRNSIPNSRVVYGLTVVSPPDENGAFHLQQAERQSGERDRDPVGYAVFLPATGCSGDLEADKADYAAFIGRVIEAARRVREVEPADDRLSGFHGG
ncbi:hypothetical protein [Enterovirga aerilata]|uniref:Uncharacterized protein n=1 Tax=Enterovirga aerilata TaxID=2730920 RepID=A0A849I3T1_9HYPH|nr:hypothetical protein [Enterovirga sp. DB1703]NNM72018.1 hypothetical protein [Enterovirga sp. DB1703]